MSSQEEVEHAVAGARQTSLPIVFTMSFDTNGRTMMGVTSPAMVEMVEALPNSPLAFGANCGTGASDLLRTVLGFAATGTSRPIIAKGNAVEELLNRGSTTILGDLADGSFVVTMEGSVGKGKLSKD